MNKQTNTSSFQRTNSDNAASYQKPYIEQAFGSAADAFKQTGQNQYVGDLLAKFRPEQLANFQNMLGFANTDQTPNKMGAVGDALTGAGVPGSTNAISKLGAFSPTGGVDANVANATKYANNPAMDGMVDAAMRDARRSVYEGALPASARSSAMSGNVLSSKRALREGVIERGLAEKTADVSAGLRGDAFDRGLALSESGRQFDNSAVMDALAKSGALAGDATKTGVASIDQALAQRGSLFDMAGAAGAGLREGDQAVLDAARIGTEYGNQNTWDNLARFYSIIGDKSWGGTQTTAGTARKEEDPGVLAKVAAGLGAAGQLFGMVDPFKSLFKPAGE